MSFVTLYVTHKNMNEAKKIANHLLKNKLIACVNYFPITSSYWWKGKITSSKEIVTILKSQTKSWKNVEKEILKIHPYDIPCIMKTVVSANTSYEAWIINETK